MDLNMLKMAEVKFQTNTAWRFTVKLTPKHQERKTIQALLLGGASYPLFTTLSSSLFC